MPEHTHPFAIEVDGLSKRFGRFVAVDHLSFAIRPGEVFGFLGPNGSGKSTTIRMLAGILPPSGGTGRVAGFDIMREGRRIKPVLGYMSQRFSLYRDLTVSENLDFFAGIYGVPSSERADRKAWALRLVDLLGQEGTRAGSLPGGWKQRLALAAAILHRPRIVMLDEPTSGVDPLSRRAFWDLIYELARARVTVLVTTHYMDEAERCDRIGLIARGRLLALGSPLELRNEVGGHMVEVDLPAPLAALRVARSAPAVREATLFGARLHVLLDAPAAEAPFRRHLAEAGHPVTAVVPVSLSMDDVFTTLVERADAGAARA